MLGALALARLPERRVTAASLGAAVVAVAGSGMAYVATPDLRIVALSAVALGATAGFFVPLQRTLIHRDTPKPAVGRVIGTSEMLSRGSELLPLAFAPAAAAAFGVQQTLLGGLTIVLVVALASLPAAVRIDRGGHLRPVPPQPTHVATDEPISPPMP
ncbi:MAG: hypothetical protein IBX62_01030 [Coriobacteriia bacterium]|nr:hypothetical protein [Coriobacteriia bacterium]